MFAIQVDCVVGNLGVIGGAESFAGIRIWIVARCATGSNVDTQSMAFIEHNARGPEIDFEWIKLVRLEQLFASERLAEACAQDALADVEGAAIGIDIAQFGEKIG